MDALLALYSGTKKLKVTETSTPPVPVTSQTMTESLFPLPEL